MKNDQELLTFATQVVEEFGGIVEPQDETVLAVLPKPLAKTLQVREEVRLGSEKYPLLYGSPLLDRLIHLATDELPLVFGHIDIPYLKKAGFEQQLAQDFVFTNAKTHIMNRAEARATYMVLTCRYIALSDERKEGLTTISIQEQSGARIEEFEYLWPQYKTAFYTAHTIPPHFPVRVEHAVNSAMHGAQRQIEEQLQDFTQSMRRRLQRDVTNTREYYQALEQEMRSGLAHPTLSDTQKEERLAKIQDLPQEMERKIEDLKHKYTIRITLRGGALRRFLVDVVKVMVEIRHKKYQRQLPLVWNPVTGCFDPVVCETCQATIRQIYFRPDKSELKIVCERCAQKK